MTCSFTIINNYGDFLLSDDFCKEFTLNFKSYLNGEKKIHDD